MVGRSGDLRGITQPHLGGPVWPTWQHLNNPVCTETEGGRQAARQYVALAESHAVYATAEAGDTGVADTAV